MVGGRAGRQQQDRQRPPTFLEAKAQQLAMAKRNPRHRRWYTRNICLLQNGVLTSIIRKIHPPLILEFNGQIVVP